MPSVDILSYLYFMNGFDIRKHKVNFAFSSNESLLVWDASYLQIKLSSKDLRKNDSSVSMLIHQFKLPLIIKIFKDGACKHVSALEIA